MKLRIRENTLRIRITQSELSQLGKGNKIKSTIHFPNNSRLSYGLQSGGQDDTSILFADNTILIHLGVLDVETLLEESNVGIQSMHTTSTGSLDLLIEKDFSCLHNRGKEDDDTFPNPNSKENA